MCSYLAASSASAYSMISLVSEFAPLMPEGGACVSLTYLASERSVHCRPVCEHVDAGRVCVCTTRKEISGVMLRRSVMCADARGWGAMLQREGCDAGARMM
eukprot:1123571-Rhodomonas_salina.1